MTAKIQVTKNYRLFCRSEDNRPTNANSHKKLAASMKHYGFLKCFPIVCYRDKKGNLIVKDGQHRLAIAADLGLPVYWVEVDVDFNTAEINDTPVVWKLRDFATMYVNKGHSEYQKALDYSELHGLPLGMSVALLAGYVNFGAVEKNFVNGTFKVKDQAWADMVASVYTPIVKMTRQLRNARFIEACMAVCRVEVFDPKRMIQCAERCREKLVPYSTRDAYLDMLEEIYNFGRQRHVGLKAEAVNAMRSRNAAVVKSEAKKARKSAVA